MRFQARSMHACVHVWYDNQFAGCLSLLGVFLLYGLVINTGYRVKVVFFTDPLQPNPRCIRPLKFRNAMQAYSHSYRLNDQQQPRGRWQNTEFFPDHPLSHRFESSILSISPLLFLNKVSLFPFLCILFTSTIM